ncbi:protein-disulfide isomerase [Mycolicibacterium duvalii]|uniref:Protein disulfide-isomerase n=1 Tax=Mycolicibacterium duvalii TaxID=39688 RepID=A0A7I7K586_9MYCO|nr:thioredoxin domain-containing protein [Mycolicibacterium duvalii]MCV7367636.1 thioredoxin domain-containing protein [Mycolicibacterium duvalii]PEG44063.1 protein-disulfide isomerase [Mycolicibacterium duvalii]BBX18774.1 protein disulfide-isomerase [Mycolicibacterium duvalii]
MRSSRKLVLIAALCLLVGVVGCTRQLSGAAVPSAVTAPLAISEDGFGIDAGFDDAPAHVEIFTEPQCTHCADLQRDFGDAIAYYITVGALKVTYRPLTFLDEDYDGYSATVANAMFVAAQPAGTAAATGAEFQRFVKTLWENQTPGGEPFGGAELRDMALSAGLPEEVAGAIADGTEGVDVVDMDDANFAILFDVDPYEAGTPTVFDMDAGQKLDIYDDNWLDELVGS